MGVILDSSVLIAAERKKLAWDEFTKSLGKQSLFIASITLSELWHGCHRAAGAVLRNRLKFVKQVESLIPVLEFAAEEARVHAEIWARLEEKGEKIGPHDLIIAATALAHQHSVATLNEKEFSRIPDLWLESMDRFLLK
ncbi:MAG: PIN domain-containing protein [Methylacidiphilales bacterium]|nr:PIN domain-containing protein [Candidatus Methylacidiphilales bacterium]